ncbi:MAG: hypothetical protein VXY99_09990 [Pseudomonadota bacterium]|nr:hypothetical protein [Pseudomonadota bacterium]
MIAAVINKAAKQTINQLASQFIKQQVNKVARRDVAAALQELELDAPNARQVAKRYVKLDRKMQGRIKFTALRDGCNFYRRAVRKAWRGLSVKEPTNVYRKQIARGHQVKRVGRDSVFVGTSYTSTPKARIGPLLEWGTNKFSGYRVSSKTFERVQKDMRKEISTSFMVQVLKTPECAKGRREAIKAARND